VFNGQRLAFGVGWEAFRGLAIASKRNRPRSLPFYEGEADGSITWPPNIER
jgi:hypothetical protein